MPPPEAKERDREQKTPGELQKGEKKWNVEKAGAGTPPRPCPHSSTYASCENEVD
jgi:hypothetical protein